MNTIAPTVTIILETRKPNKEGLYPVCLRVTFMREAKYYRLKYPLNLNDSELREYMGTIYLSKDDYDKVMKPNPPKGYYKSLKLILNTYELRAIDVIKRMEYFDFDQFMYDFFDKSTGIDDTDIFNVMQRRAVRLREEGRISTAITFECALRSLVKFHGKDRLKFQQITAGFLTDYEKEMLKNGASTTTIGIYLRNVRTLFNESHIENLHYPFGKKSKGLYQIPTGKNVKKALSMEQIISIATIELSPGSWEEICRDLWLLSYLANGANIKDILRLKYKDIDGDVIRFVRSKTARSRNNQQYIEIIITPRIGRILDRHGSKGIPDAYIFEVLKPGMTPKEEYRAIQQMTANINHNMARLAKRLEIPHKITTYTARHSFASILKRAGVSTEFIQESLGHTSPETTQNYLASFELDQKRKIANLLLPENL